MKGYPSHVVTSQANKVGYRERSLHRARYRIDSQRLSATTLQSKRDVRTSGLQANGIPRPA